jgi:uncharacterized membrane protein YgcG
LSGSITDQTGLLAAGSQQIQAAQQRLLDTTGIALSVLFVPSSGGVPIDQFAADAAQHDGLGSRDVLLVAAVADHAESLQVGAGLHDTITRNEIAGVLAQFEDRLRVSDDVGGVVAVADALGAAVVPTPTPAAIAHPTDGPPSANVALKGKHGGSASGGGTTRELLAVLAVLVLIVGGLWLAWRLTVRRRRAAGPAATPPNP